MTTPSTREAIDRVIEAGRRNLHTCFPARVLSYDVGSQTVAVQPQLMRELSDEEGALEYEALPPLYDVPVQWPRGGGFAMTFPLAAGDYVAILCAEQSTLAWRKSGSVSEPGLSQPHGLNGCVALCGWYPDGQRMLHVSTSDLVLRNKLGTTQIVVDEATAYLGSKVGAVPIALAPLVVAALQAMSSAVTAAAAAMVVVPADPVSAGAKAGATAVAGALATWVSTVSVGATKARAL